MGNLTMTRQNTKSVVETVGPTGLGSSGITGWSFWMTVKYDAGDPDSAAVFQKLPAAWTIQSVGNAATAGVVVCTIAPVDTASLPPYQSVLTFDVQAEDASGNRFTIDSGAFTVQANVTDAG